MITRVVHLYHVVTFIDALPVDVYVVNRPVLDTKRVLNAVVYSHVMVYRANVKSYSEPSAKTYAR